MKKTTFSIVNSKDEAITNVVNYGKTLETEEGKPLEKIMPNVRSWYVVEDNGRLYFGPSKFIGYNAMTAEHYMEHTKEMDGRNSEKRLKEWGQPVLEGDPEYQRVHTALTEFLGSHGKSLNKVATIAFLSQDQAMNTYTEADIVHALKVLISTLSEQAKKDLKRAL